jgi:hypothetical protein
MLALCSVAAVSTARPIIGILALPVEHSDCITLTEEVSTPTRIPTNRCVIALCAVRRRDMLYWL